MIFCPINNLILSTKQQGSAWYLDLIAMLLLLQYPSTRRDLNEGRKHAMLHEVGQKILRDRRLKFSMAN